MKKDKVLEEIKNYTFSTIMLGQEREIIYKKAFIVNLYDAYLDGTIFEFIKKLGITASYNIHTERFVFKYDYEIDDYVKAQVEGFFVVFECFLTNIVLDRVMTKTVESWADKKPKQELKKLEEKYENHVHGVSKPSQRVKEQC